MKSKLVLMVASCTCFVCQVTHAEVIQKLFAETPVEQRVVASRPRPFDGTGLHMTPVDAEKTLG